MYVFNEILILFDKLRGFIHTRIKSILIFVNGQFGTEY